MTMYPRGDGGCVSGCRHVPAAECHPGKRECEETAGSEEYQCGDHDIAYAYERRHYAAKQYTEYTLSSDSLRHEADHTCREA